MTKPTQNDRVLHALMRAGARGITQVDFDLPNVIDGGTPIKRIAARVHELRKGFVIDEDGWRHKCRVYVYAGPIGRVAQTASRPAPGRDRVVESAPSAEPVGTLFDAYVDRDTSHWKAA